MRLDGKIALVTGGGAGIGRAICLALAREGAGVLVADIRPEPAQAVAAEVRALGRQGMGVALDVTNEARVGQVVADGIRALGRLDILVNAEMSVEKAHALTDYIIADIEGVLPRSTVTIHIEPCDLKCPARCLSNCGQPTLTLKQ